MTFVAGSLAGTPVRRVEDDSLLRGKGTYVDNLRIPGTVHLEFVRSPFAHAEIGAIDVTTAAGMAGVVAVHTAASLEAPGFVGMMAVHPGVTRAPLASGRVFFAGDTVAVVVAESKSEAVDAAEAVEVDYEPLPAVIDMEDALAPGAAAQYEAVPGNLLIGDRDSAGADVLEGADVVVRGRFENPRLAVVPMEGSAVIVDPRDDGDGHELTVHLACQMPHASQAQLAGLFGLDRARVRVIAPNVGGAFGAKHLSAEAVVAVTIARALGRPVSWVETRSENLVGMAHGRGQVQYIELGLRRDGTIVGLRCRIVGDAGAYAGFGGLLPGMMTRIMASGVYRIPRIAYDVAVALTNTTPMGAYRGAGRPEATAFVERIMDLAAAELEMDPAELRRRNLIDAADFPYVTPTGAHYDSGDYRAALDEALRLADYDALRAEQAERRARGDRCQLGIGLSTYVEITGGGEGEEFASVEVHADGTATVKAGTSAHGQGHATAFSMLAADRLGIPMEDIRFVQSDTATVPRGGGTGGSRSLQLGGTAVAETADALVARAKTLAAESFEASPEDIVITSGGLGVAGVPSRTIAWGEVSRLASEQGAPLAVDHDAHQAGATFPFGAHVSVVEVDLDTGRVTPRRHIAVDDCGRILNPLLVDGQVHGGLASGISQALWEQFVYDADGNPLTTTLAEYPMPSAAELITFELAHTETPTPLNSIGAKGIGESATVGSTPAVQNAVVDALSHLGVRHVDIPCTAERVWRAVRAAEGGTLAPVWREPPGVFTTAAQGGSGGDEEEFNL